MQPRNYRAGWLRLPDEPSKKTESARLAHISFIKLRMRFVFSPYNFQIGTLHTKKIGNNFEKTFYFANRLLFYDSSHQIEAKNRRFSRHAFIIGLPCPILML